MGVSGSFPQVTAASFDDVMSPFMDSHQASLERSSSAATYQLAWGQDARFMIESVLRADSVNGNAWNASAGGSIDLSVTEDVLVQYRARIDATLPADQMRASLILGVLDPSVSETILSVSEIHDTTFGVGFQRLEAEGQFMLPANRVWDFRYDMSIRAQSSSAGFQGTGSGFVEFLIIPEPQAVLLLLIGLSTRRCRRA